MRAHEGTVIARRRLIAAAAVCIGLAVGLSPPAGSRASLAGPRLAARTPAPRAAVLLASVRSWPPGSVAIPTSTRAGWAFVGTGLLHTIDGGGRWRTVSLPRMRPGAPGLSMPTGFVLDGSHAWVAGMSPSGRSLLVARVRASGRLITVTRIAPIPRAGWASLTLVFRTPLVGWLLLTPEPPGPNGLVRDGVLYATRNGGRTWSVADRSTPFGTSAVSVGAAQDPGQLVFTSATRGFAVGVVGPGLGHCYATRDGGRTWGRCRLPVPPSYGLGDMPGTVRIVGSAGFVLGGVGTGMNSIPFVDMSADGGRTWTRSRLLGQLDHNNTGPPVVVRPVTANAWWVSDNRALLRTRDAGRTWQAVRTPPLPRLTQIVGLEVPSLTVAWVTLLQPTLSLRETIWATSDAGRSWSVVTPPGVPVGGQAVQSARRFETASYCDAGQLVISVPGRGAGSFVPVHGGYVSRLTFRNRGRLTCTLTGWPLVQGFTASGHRLAVSIRYGEDGQDGYIAVTTVTLRPGATAAAWLETASGAAPRACRSGAWALRVAPPENFTGPIVRQPPSHPEPCPGSTLLISPVHPPSVPMYSSYPGPRPPAHVCRSKDLSVRPSGQGTATQYVVWLLVVNRGTACTDDATAAIAFDHSGSPLPVPSNPVRFEAEWVFRHGPNTPFHIWWENWCGPRTGLAVRATVGPLSTVAPLVPLPECLSHNQPSLLAVFAGP